MSKLVENETTMTAPVEPEDDRDTLTYNQYVDMDLGRWMRPDTRRKIRNLMFQQRVDAKGAFLRHFMSWVGEQAKDRKLGLDVLARRRGLGIGTVTRHFRYPAVMPMEYVIWYQMALGVCFDFIPLPVTRLSEMPGYKAPV